ncbi:hypothetical protein KCU91_g2487, partial [Aureobasidium melanogenum]
MSATNSSEKHLASMLDRLQANGAYSDLKIVCGSDTYLVPKAIVCPQSDFFRAACRSNAFKEGQTGVVNISASSGRDDDFFTRPISAEIFDWDLDVETTQSVKLMIHYFYHHDYLEQETSRGSQKAQLYFSDCRKGAVAEHSRMYAMGEKYGIPGLKNLAIAKFRLSAITWVNHAGLAAGIAIVYNSTPEADKGLRKEVIEALDRYRLYYTSNSEIQKMIASIPDLCYGLYRKVLEHEGLR